MKTLLRFGMVFCFAGMACGQIDVPVSILNISNATAQGIFPTLPTGQVTFAGVLFNIPVAVPEWDSNPNSLAPDLAFTQNVNIASVQSVHLLMNTANTYTNQMNVGDTIGFLKLIFLSGTTNIPLQVGVNIRERAIGTIAQPVITNISSPSVVQGWSGINNGGILSVFDVFTVTISNNPALNVNPYLQQVIVLDNSISSIGQVNPVIIVNGITVSVPEPSSLSLILLATGSAWIAARGRRFSVFKRCR